ncbi:MAG: NHL repeat-containing protein [Ignavibacteriaceae bacterium]
MRIFLLLLISSALLHGQSYVFQKSIGNFRDASSFSISNLGFIYLADATTNEISKMDFKGNILKQIGGYGWENGLFDLPLDIFASALNVYVADKNNNRIQILDKDLNLIRIFKSNPVGYSYPVFAYPVAVSVSNQGDLLILDGDNRNIHKYDINGNFITTFGGVDAGDLTIGDPRDLFIDGNKAIYILDGYHSILTYDTFGNPLGITQLGPEIISVNGFGRIITLTAKNEIFTIDMLEPGLPTSKLTLVDCPEVNPFVSSLIFDSTLYILTSDKILIFELTQ